MFAPCLLPRLPVSVRDAYLETLDFALVWIQ